MHMCNRFEPVLIYAFDADQIVPRSLEAVNSHGVSILGEGIDVAVRRNRHRWADVAEVPPLAAPARVDMDKGRVQPYLSPPRITSYAPYLA